MLAAAVRGLAQDDSRRRVIGVGSRMIGVPGRPRSPENTTIVSRPPVGRAIRIRTIAEPRMWPASSSVTWTPCAASCSVPYGIGAEHRQREVDVVLGVQRVDEIEHDLRAGLAQQLLGVGAARALGALDRQLQRRVERRRVALGVGGGAAGVTARAAGGALGELHLELGRVEQHEAGELRGRRGADDRRPGSPRGRAAAGGRSGRGGRGSGRPRRASSGRTPSGTRLRIVSSRPPWNMPQSMRTRARPVSTRWREPVTVRAPPRKVSSMHRSSHIAIQPTACAWHDGGHDPTPSGLAQPRGRVPRRARRPRPARRRAGDGPSHRTSPTSSSRPPPPSARCAPSWRRWTARWRSTTCPTRTRVPCSRSAPRSPTASRAPVGLPVSPPVSTSGLWRSRRVGSGDRGGWKGAPDAAGGVLRRDRGGPRGRRRDACRDPGSSAASARSRTRSARRACSSRWSRCGVRSTATAARRRRTAP